MNHLTVAAKMVGGDPGLGIGEVIEEGRGGDEDNELELEEVCAFSIERIINGTNSKVLVVFQLHIFSFCDASFYFSLGSFQHRVFHGRFCNTTYLVFGTVCYCFELLINSYSPYLQHF